MPLLVVNEHLSIFLIAALIISNILLYNFLRSRLPNPAA